MVSVTSIIHDHAPTRSAICRCRRRPSRGAHLEHQSERQRHGQTSQCSFVVADSSFSVLPQQFPMDTRERVPAPGVSPGAVPCGAPPGDTPAAQSPSLATRGASPRFTGKRPCPEWATPARFAELMGLTPKKNALKPKTGQITWASFSLFLCEPYSAAFIHSYSVASTGGIPFPDIFQLRD